MSEPSRRRFIVVGLSGAVVLGLGGAALGFLDGSGYALLPGEKPIALSAKQLSVVRALVEVLAPGGGGLPAGLELGLLASVDYEVWAADDHVAADLKAALELLEHLPPLFGRFARFTRLDHAARAEVFDRMLRSRRDTFVQIAIGLKQLVYVHYFSNERVWQVIGYDGPWVKQAKPPESALAYAALAGWGRGT